MRRLALAAALVLAGSCGGSPTAPTPPETLPAVVRPVVLGSGPYVLSLALSSTGNPVCQNGICTSVSFCIDTNNAAGKAVSLDVDLERSADTATVRVPGSGTPLLLSLVVAASSVTGTIAGSARDAAGVLIDVSGAVIGAAPPNTAVAVSGSIDGHMSVAGGSCSNNGHSWSLAPR